MQMVHFIPSSQRRVAMLAASADTAPVLVCGANGTGKSAIAQWIHSNGPRSTRPMLTASLKSPLLRQIARAKGTTLVIPEIGEWPLSDQKILLDLLKTKSIPHPDEPGMRMLINVRIIATASQQVDSRARGGLFNAELLEKISVFRIEMPPLYKRLDEFEDIAQGIVSEITRELHKEHLRSFSNEARNRLLAYDWPGNIRELRNVLKIAAISAKGDRIESTDLPDFGHDRIDFHATRAEFEKALLSEWPTERLPSQPPENRA